VEDIVTALSDLAELCSFDKRCYNEVIRASIVCGTKDKKDSTLGLTSCLRKQLQL